MSVKFSVVIVGTLLAVSAGCKSREIRLAERHINAREYSKAVDALSGEIRAHPQNVEALLLLGKVRLMQLETDEANSAFDRAEAVSRWTRQRIAEAWFEAAKNHYAMRPDTPEIPGYLLIAAAKDSSLKKPVLQWILTSAARERQRLSGVSARRAPERLMIVPEPEPDRRPAPPSTPQERAGLDGLKPPPLARPLELAGMLSPEDGLNISREALSLAGAELRVLHDQEAASYAMTAVVLDKSARQPAAALLTRIAQGLRPLQGLELKLAARCFELAGEFDPALAETNDEVWWHRNATPYFDSAGTRVSTLQVVPRSASKRQAAEDYLRYFPSGSHAADAQKIISSREEELPPPGGVLGGVPHSVVPAPPPRTPTSASPLRIRVGGNVQASKLVKKVKPVYPQLAKAARIQGTVRFMAVIDKTGHITNLQLDSGHPLLVQAAQEAVKQWLYQPTFINGEPVEVVTQIEVSFALGNT